MTSVAAEVPDATDSLNNEFERVKESGEQFFGVRDVLEQLTQKVTIARDEGRLTEEAVLTPESRGREPRERLLLEQTTLECAKENPSDLGTRIPESEARSDRVSRLGTVAVNSRCAVLWMTRAKWNCLGGICELTRADSASDEVIASVYWFKRWNCESECWCRRSSRKSDAVLHIHRSRTKACLTSTRDAECVDNIGKQQWSWS